MKLAALAVLAACTSPGETIPAIALDVAPYPDGSGTMLRATVVVDGSAPIPVLVDTGSVGLRVFAADLAGVSIATTGELASVALRDDTLGGRVATGTVQLGDVELPGDLAFQIVDQFASGDGSQYTAAGIHGILGIGLGDGAPAAIYNPLAQLTGITSYAIHTGGLGSTAGTLELAADPRGYTQHDLAPAGTQPDGLVAWADDAFAACYMVGGSPIDPPCTATLVDSGAKLDTIYAPAITGDALPDGTAFAASFDAFTIDFTAGTTPSADLVHLDHAMPHATLGIATFLRFDVVYDLATGAIGFRAI